MQKEVKQPFFFLHGAPGDVMCGIGNALAHPEFEEPANFFFYGNDPSVAEFIKAQAFTKQVVHLAPSNSQEYQKSIVELCVKPNEQNNQMLWDLARRAGFNHGHGDRIITVHVGHRCKIIDNVVHHWHSTSLPSECMEWADSVLRKNGNPNILVNPFSFQSNTLNRHWPFWSRFLHWLDLKGGSWNSYITGIGWNRQCKANHVISLQDQAKTNNHVLALALLCDGIITTTNNLSHWAVIAGIPIINVVNAAVTDPNWYFRKWYHFPKAKFVEHTDPYMKLIQTVESWDVINSGAYYY